MIAGFNTFPSAGQLRKAMLMFKNSYISWVKSQNKFSLSHEYVLGKVKHEKF